MMTLSVRDQIHALRWRAAADALVLDPCRDPDIAALAALRRDAAGHGEKLQRLANECHRVADSASKTAAELAEIHDLLSERMALLDAERPGATIIDLLKGMLEATAQKPEAAPLDIAALLARFPSEAKIVIIDNHKMVPGGVYPQVMRVRSTREEPGRYSISSVLEQSAAVLLEVFADGSVEVHKNRYGTTGRILSPLAVMRQRAEVAEALVRRRDSEVEAFRDEADRATKADFEARKVLLAVKGFTDSTRTTAQLAEDVAARLTATGDEMAKQRARADMAESDLAEVRARSNSRGDALRALGWDGEEDPKVWAPRFNRSNPHSELLALLSPLRIALGAMGTNVPKRIVEIAVQQIEAAARDGREAARQAALHEVHRQNLAELRALIAGHETADSAQVLRGAIDAITGLREEVKTIAAHRWQATDLQALLGHERHMRREADKDLHELTRPLWPWLTLRDIAPRGIVRQLVEVLQEQHRALTHNGSIAEFTGPDEDE